MNNNSCPVCGKKAEGKAVRRVHFCTTHRELAVTLRDSKNLKEIEKQKKRHFWDQSFSQLVIDYIRDGNTLLRYRQKKS